VTILLIGFDYQHSSVEIREQLYLKGDDLRKALTSLHKEPLTEVVIVSTCNRLEIYAQTDNVEQAAEKIIDYLIGQTVLPAVELQRTIQKATNQVAVHHLMRVACGLESLLLGETEILGQVTDALKQAQQMETCSLVLSRLFQVAVHSGKRARTETAISQHALSLSHVAVLMAKSQIADLGSAKALVIGAGRMAELAVKALKAHGAADICVINRTYSSALSLAAHSEINAMEWDHLASALAASDLIITATSAPHAILQIDDIAQTQAVCESRPLLIIDISVPRNVHQEVGLLPDVTLYDIDDLQAVVEDHRAKRHAEIAQVETIIDEQANAFVGWMNSRSTVSTIVTMRHKAQQLAEAEVTRTLHKLPNLSEQEREIVSEMAHRIVNKMLHAPTTALQEQAAQGDHYSYLHAVQQLFDLEIEAHAE
jgi:glutamyl-tRNA reductase